MTRELSRREYTELYGPTTGGTVRLGDTGLRARVEADYRTPGDEAVFRGGKTLRDGLGMAPGVTPEEGALDWVVTNATILDPVLSVVAAGAGIPAREARLVHGYAFLSNVLGVAQRLMRLGHTEAQRILRDLSSVVEAVEARARELSVDDMDPFAPGIDLAAM